MDEMTHRIALQIPDDMLEFLAMIAKREGFETRKTGRAIRWCIREAQKAHDKDGALQGEIAITGGPPETKPVAAQEAFYRPIEDLIK
jgi:metal-responsive CopG/Arc/MetJ family transcriptional regulator